MSSPFLVSRTTPISKSKRPLNILIGSNVHWWNADAAYAAVTAEILEGAGHRVFVLTRPHTVNFAQLQKRGLRLLTDIDLNTCNPFRLYFSYQRLKQFLRIQQIQIVNPHRSEGLFIYVLLKWSLRSFKLVRTRGTARMVRGGWLNQMIYRDWVDAHIFTGEAVLERVLKRVEVPRYKQNVIHYPVERAELPPSVDYTKAFNIPRDHRVLAIVGRLSPLKGHQLLLKSFQLLRRQLPRTILLVLFNHPDFQCAEMQAIEETSKILGIEANVRFIGVRADIRSIMKFVDVGVVSSLDSEMICRVAVEFFSVATPVVALPTGCLPEIVKNGVNGFVAKTATAEDLYQALRKILEEDELLEKLSRGALEQTGELFSHELFLTKTMRVFEAALFNSPYSEGN